ncbi:MAG TPA: hypothetical protein VGK91_09545 [Candidatus Udaeobacter sp.]
MSAIKRNLSVRRVGKGRGVPIRLARGIARKYSLARLVIWTLDRQRRQRIVCWGGSNTEALVSASFAKALALSIGWSEEASEFQLGFIRRSERRIKELEAALAQIIEREGDPIEIARAAGKFPRESDEENLGAWLFFPKGRLTLAENLQKERAPDDRLVIARLSS